MDSSKERFGMTLRSSAGSSGGRIRSTLEHWRALWVGVFAVIVMASTVKASDVVIVVDVSGSMSEGISSHDKRVRVTVVQEALREYLPALPSRTRVDLIAFNSGIVSDQEVVLRDKQDLERALAWVDGLAAETRRGKGTYLWTTLRRALKTAARYAKENPEQPVTVRVLTDGEDNERVTTLDKVLQEFLPMLDGEMIRSNLVLLGDIELKTKFSLPEGAFETTRNPNWEVLLPPILLWAPTEPRIGDEVRLFESNTRSIYKDYEWQVDGVAVGNDKVLTWVFREPRSYRVTLKATGLRGTRNSATAFVKVMAKPELGVDFVISAPQPEPQQDVRFIGRCDGQRASFAWFVGSNQVANTQNMSFRFTREGSFDVKLVATDSAGSSGTRVQRIDVKERPLAALIKGPAEAISGRAAQFAAEITGSCSSIEWRFGDGATSSERNPQHTFDCKDAEFTDRAVSLRATSPSGKVIESVPHAIRVWAEKKAPAPQAAFRTLPQTPKVGEPIQLVNDTTGPVDTVQWDVDGEPQSSERNPQVRVSDPGEKTFRLTVRGPGGQSIATRKVTVNPRYAQPAASFSASKLSGTAPLTVQFTHQVTGDFKSLLWEFGDGQTSTDSNPRHTFTSSRSYDVSLIAYPVESSHTTTEYKTRIRATEPWPVWVKATAGSLLCLAPLAGVVGLIHRRRRKALRLPVYYWAEQAPACQTVVLTEADETMALLPAAPIQIIREGRSRSLTVHPLQGATLLAASGQQASMLSIGDSLRVTVRDANGLTRAVAISTRQKPRRPEATANETQALPDDGVCGLLKPTEPTQCSSDSGEFDWGLRTHSTNVG